METFSGNIFIRVCKLHPYTSQIFADQKRSRHFLWELYSGRIFNSNFLAKNCIDFGSKYTYLFCKLWDSHPWCVGEISVEFQGLLTLRILWRRSKALWSLYLSSLVFWFCQHKASNLQGRGMNWQTWKHARGFRTNRHAIYPDLSLFLTTPRDNTTNLWKKFIDLFATLLVWTADHSVLVPMNNFSVPNTFPSVRKDKTRAILT